ncbi:plastocyanin/azurin family copper-binding protein [Salinarimonas sp.]|uniref:cupredoxin domain-containing protein n=1 Tax=Salinarimonas sp. TaxID=2766526 RepID=UPI0032D9A2C2
MAAFRPSSIGPAFFLAAALATGPGIAQEPAAVVEMTNDLEFVPESVTIRAGETVEWRNVGTAAHTVTADPDEAADPDHVVLPEGAETFNSGVITGGGSFTHTFEAPGRYAYFCIPHERTGMLGEVIVEE